MLITPHGDRKRQGQGVCVAYQQSHYPSWGSKTPVSRPRRPAWALVSLPLMGIENSGAAAGGSHCPVSSLPLMGIENAPDGALHLVRDRALITPHGDRKPGRTAPSRLPKTTHYPSWGSKTSTGAPSRVVISTAHYPSWGSKTLKSPASRSCGVSVSLPLMGIENPSRLPMAVVRSNSSLPLMGIENPASPSMR